MVEHGGQDLFPPLALVALLAAVVVLVVGAGIVKQRRGELETIET